VLLLSPPIPRPLSCTIISMEDPDSVDTCRPRDRREEGGKERLRKRERRGGGSSINQKVSVFFPEKKVSLSTPRCSRIPQHQKNPQNQVSWPRSLFFLGFLGFSGP
jgi:hypothetical protein